MSGRPSSPSTRSRSRPPTRPTSSLLSCRRSLRGPAELRAPPALADLRALGRGRRLERRVFGRLCAVHRSGLLLVVRVPRFTPPPPGGNLTRQGLPDPVAFRQRIEELAVEQALVGVAKVPPVRMAEALDETEPPLDRLSLRLPRRDGALAQQREERVVLRQRVGQLDQPSEHVGPEAAAAARLR